MKTTRKWSKMQKRNKQNHINMSRNKIKAISNVVFLVMWILGALHAFAQTPYDAFAPEQRVKPMLELPKVQFRITNPDSEGEIRFAELDKDGLSLILYGNDGGIIKTLKLNPGEKKFLSIDPLASKYPSISPYVYCLNNPVIFVDPNGMDVWEIDAEGRIIKRIKDTTQDAFYMVNPNADGTYERIFMEKQEGGQVYKYISFQYGTIESQRSISYDYYVEKKELSMSTMCIR